MTAATARPQTALKRLAGVLAFVCLVLFLLAIEQKQTVAAWEAVRYEAVPAARRVADWAGRLPSGAADGFQGLKAAVKGAGGPLAATPGSTAILSGEYGPADADTREAAGSLTMVRAELRFETGDTLRTRPLRIAFGRESFAPGQTFAARLNAPADAQVELRAVVPPARGQAAPPLKLCGGEPAGVVALLHRGSRVDVMLFRPGFVIGGETPPAALCGAWTFEAR
ncbi:hypothetical protein GGQ87_000785 [Brevundimonas alba]|uniref:Uncharacterized protein n=1 Tax=Brevundimonas alba TaxID=74314 RepID=A0A7X5YIF6_9CAUL|nr:hypothetical protein [Brevundimonas alba]NJC40527.1 hypothetical protein [Brevundimonas alba]